MIIHTKATLNATKIYEYTTFFSRLIWLIKDLFHSVIRFTLSVSHKFNAISPKVNLNTNLSL